MGDFRWLSRSATSAFLSWRSFSLTFCRDENAVAAFSAKSDDHATNAAKPRERKPPTFKYGCIQEAEKPPPSPNKPQTAMAEASRGRIPETTWEPTFKYAAYAEKCSARCFASFVSSFLPSASAISRK